MSTEIKSIGPDEFDVLIARHDLHSEKMIEACRRVFVGGETRRAASIATGVNYASLHRTVRKLEGYCPHCGQALPDASKVSLREVNSAQAGRKLTEADKRVLLAAMRDPATALEDVEQVFGVSDKTIKHHAPEAPRRIRTNKKM